MAFPAKRADTCKGCNGPINVGDSIVWFRYPVKTGGTSYHAGCHRSAAPEASSAPQSSAPQSSEPRSEQPRSEPRPASPGSIDEAIDRRIEEKLGGFKPESALDEDRVKALIEENSVRRVLITVQRDDGTTVETKGEHFMMPRLLRLVRAGLNLQLWGPAGTAKTSASLRAAKLLGRTAETDTFGPSTPESRILGFIRPNGEPVLTPFLRCFESGGVYVADEDDNAPAPLQNAFNSALANGHASTMWGPIARSPTFQFIGCANTPLLGPTPQFRDRQPASHAFRDRLYFVFWPEDENIIRRECGLPEINHPERAERQCTIAEWAEWVLTVKRFCNANVPAIVVTPRAALEGKKAIAAGETPLEMAHGLVFRGADEALVSKVLTACPLP